MRRKFNTTTICIKEDHYMVDISKKLEEIKKMIDYGMYFNINRARQYGKTTTMNLLLNELQYKYIMIAGSLEGWGEEVYKTEERFAMTFLDMLSKEVKFQDKKLSEYIGGITEVTTFYELSEVISNICNESEKEIVLMIDEVDKASNNLLFLDFLATLRNKYNDQKKNRLNKTFKSVILAGVHDVKNLKLHIKERRILKEEEVKMIDKTIYNSPWNVAESFNVDMSFNKEEIATMLINYEKDYKTGMNIDTISTEITNYTSGYPFLVSKICKTIDERLGKDWSLYGIQEAVKILQEEKNTLFDDLIKNINNNNDLYNTVYDMLILGKEKTYDVYTYEIGIMYGIFRKGENGKLAIHNKIFEILLYNYLTTNKELTETKIINYESRNQFIDGNNNIKMEKVLSKFAELMYEEYREGYQEFLEREGRLIFLAFIKPIINGTGFYYVETETRTNRRMDIVITYNSKEYIIELKKWYGKKYEERGLNQLAEYLEIRKNEKGYVVVFDFSSDKHYKQEWIKVDEKDIYEVVV